MSGYTSNLLCHFVGRSKSNDDERFELLETIIKSKKLIANLSNPNNLGSSFSSGYQCEHLGEVFEKCDCVCFCDIPNESLGIHTNKYSKFGMGFERTFIAEKGAHPVMYVPKNYTIAEIGDTSEKAKTCTPKQPQLYYPHLLNTACNLLPLMELGYTNVDLNKIEDFYKHSGFGEWLNTFDNDIREKFFSGQFHPLIFSLLQGAATQLAYVKLFDTTLADDHPDNYYMEREWRSLKNIEFTLNDIKTIYLPNETYKENFIKDFPDYSGEFYLFN